jgi:hypothetical protein
MKCFSNVYEELLVYVLHLLQTPRHLLDHTASLFLEKGGSAGGDMMPLYIDFT